MTSRIDRSPVKTAPTAWGDHMFTDEAVRTICDSVGLKPQRDLKFLRGQLRSVYERYLTAINRKNLPTPRQRRIMAEKVAKLCGKLRQECLEDDKIRYGLGVSSMAGHVRGKATIEEAMKTTAKLKDLMLVAATHWQNIEDRQAGNVTNRDIALATLFIELGDVYEKQFSKEPGFSFNEVTNQRYGPFLRFVKSVLEHMKVRKTDEAIVAIWKRRHGYAPD